MKAKKLIAMFLATIMLLGIMPLSAYASNWGEGDTLDEALAELKVGFDDYLLDWLVLPSFGTVNLRFTYFWFKNERTGNVNQHPVYCIDPTKGGAYEIVYNVGNNPEDDSETATYIRSAKVSDIKYLGILQNGYPHVRLDGLGLQTVREGYYATKLARWMYILGYNTSDLTINPKYGSNDAVAMRVRDAVVHIYNAGMKVTYIPEPSLKLTSTDAIAKLDNSGEYYVQEIKVTASSSPIPLKRRQPIHPAAYTLTSCQSVRMKSLS